MKPFNTLWWILASLVPAAKGSLTTSPSNVVDFMGSKRVLFINCSKDSMYQNRYVPVRWSVMFLNSSIHILTTPAGIIDPLYASYYNVTDGTHTGQFNLGIIATESIPAGRYTCNDENGVAGFMNASSEVIILESDPVCNQMQLYFGMDYNQVTMLCTVTYYGFWAPRMQWSLLGGSNQASFDVTTNDTVTSILTINTTSSMDGQQYICKTFFNQQSLSTVTASNIPAYTYTYTAQILKAYVSTHNIFISPDQILYYPGDTITCGATGYPSPEYQWKHLNDGSSVDSSQLVINESMVDRNLTYQCTARNVIQGRSYKSSINKTFSVPCPEFCTITSSDNTRTCSIPYGRNYSWYSGTIWLHSGQTYITDLSNISCLAVVNEICSPVKCDHSSPVPTETINHAEVGVSGSNNLIIGLVVGIGGPLLILIVVVIIISIVRRKNKHNSDPVNQAKQHGDPGSKKEENYDMIGPQQMNPGDRKKVEPASKDDPYSTLNPVGSEDQHKYDRLPVTSQASNTDPYSTLQQTGSAEPHNYEWLPDRVEKQSPVDDHAYSTLGRSSDNDHHNYEPISFNQNRLR